MNKLTTWLSFHRPERRFHQLSYNLQEFPEKLNALNERRMAAQRAIIELGNESSECSRCEGKCCRGGYSHFTAVDYLLRVFSRKPIASFGEIWKPQPAASLWLSGPPRSGNPAGDTVPGSSCPNLRDNGCEFAPEDRPIRCILWTCRDFRNSLPQATLREIAELTRELGAIADEVRTIFRHI